MVAKVLCSCKIVFSDTLFNERSVLWWIISNSAADSYCNKGTNKHTQIKTKVQVSDGDVLIASLCPGYTAAPCRVCFFVCQQGGQWWTNQITYCLVWLSVIWVEYGRCLGCLDYMSVWWERTCSWEACTTWGKNLMWNNTVHQCQSIKLPAPIPPLFFPFSILMLPNQHHSLRRQLLAGGCRPNGETCLFSTCKAQSDKWNVLAFR